MVLVNPKLSTRVVQWVGKNCVQICTTTLNLVAHNPQQEVSVRGHSAHVTNERSLTAKDGGSGACNEGCFGLRSGQHVVSAISLRIVISAFWFRV